MCLIMRKISAFRNLMLVAVAAMGLNATAQNGAPHSVTASANLADVTLSWKAPASPITLQWHDGSSYNGMDGKAFTPGGTNVIYAANKFTPGDLAAVAGQQVKSISFLDYRHCYKVNVQVYENKKLVADKAADLSTYTKNEMKEVVLDAPYTIPADKEVMFVARYEYSPISALTASTDRYPTPGKGDIYSYDGKTWYQGAVGDFMITANVANDFTDQPQGYNVYRDGVKVNAELLTGTSTTLAGEPAGVHTYTVAAVYDGAEKASAGVAAKVLVPASMLAPAASFSGKATELNGVLNWQAPLKGGNTLTWSGDVAGLSIGGTAASNTKVWIKQEFTGNDLLAFQNYQINSISAYVNENSITAVTLFVIKDGVVVYNQPITDLAIQAPAWNTWDLTTPYVMEPGHTYAFGCYYLHASTTHPVGVDNTEAVDVKGNSFSTSSPSSTFNNSKPTWKTLASGNIAGNLMLKAAVSPVGEATAVADPTGYDLYRNGELVVSNTKETTFEDEVAEPGLYEYTLVTKYDGKDAPESTTSLKYTMPADFTAPIITDATFDEETKKVDIAWSASAAELKKFGTASYMVGFDEDMTMLYGAKFTAAELAPYAGYKLNKLQFAIGEDIPFKLEVRTSANEVLFSYDFPAGSIEPLSLYTMTLESSVVIPEGKDLYLCYNMTAAGGSEPILLDAGPVVDGGAMISLADGASWMKLGTINSTYNNYNIVIGATALPAGSNAPKQEITLGSQFDENMESISISGAEAREAAVNGLGVEANVEVSAPAKVAKVAPKPVAKSFKVLRNNEVVATTEGTTFSETLNEYGTFNYNVVTVFENGWESPMSKTVTAKNFIDQNAPAPFDLRGEADEDGALALTWDAPGLVQEFTYQKDYSSDLKSGMTGSGTREGYHVIRMTMDTLQHFMGQKITHIKFKLSEAVTTAAVVITVGENVIYEQPIEAADVNVGWNVIRLNTPFEITADLEQELGVGYHITYPNGVKPFTLDPTPAIPYYNDLISAAASYGYWYSLQAKYKLNYGYRISAVLQKEDTEAARKVARKAEGDAVTYNVYCDGQLVADGVAECAYTVFDAETGHYTVTAVNDGQESAPSNKVYYEKSITAVNDLNTGKTVSSVRYYNAAGIEATTAFDGVNIMVTTYSDGSKAAVKVIK